MVEINFRYIRGTDEPMYSADHQQLNQKVCLAIGEWYKKSPSACCAERSFLTEQLKEQSVSITMLQNDAERDNNGKPKYICVCDHESDEWSVSTLGWWSRSTPIMSGSF